jgi:hypothetical protein
MKAKIWFESQGRRAACKGLPLRTSTEWPGFARAAFAAGWILQQPRLKAQPPKDVSKERKQNGN